MADEKGHSPFGGSQTACYIACPGYYRMTKDLPEEGSKYAEAGSFVHEHAAARLLRRPAPKGRELEDSEEDALALYVGHCQKLQALTNSYGVEENVDLAPLVPFEVPGGLRGTVDFWALVGTTLHVIDYKNGVGVPVYLEDNAQVRFYASGLAHRVVNEWKGKIEKVRFAIVQPRCVAVSPIQEDEIPYQELIQWLHKTLTPAIERALKPDAPCSAGEKQCNFCKAKGACQAHTAWALKEGAADFTPVLEGKPLALEPQFISDSQVTNILKAETKILDWLKAVKAFALAKAKQGYRYRGFKTVRGKKNRAWKDVAEAEALLVKLFKEEAYTKKLVSPAQGEKLLKDFEGIPTKDEEALKGMIEKPLGELILVPDTDKRPEAKDTQGIEDFMSDLLS